MSTSPNFGDSKATFRSAFGLLFVLGALLVSTRAEAQGCCASGASLTPVRLDLHERALVGLQLATGAQHGSFDNGTSYRSTPDDASDIELRQTAFGTYAPLSRLQLSAMVPWLETRRSASGAPTEWGGGLGDVSLLVRGEPVALREYGDVPAIAVLGSLVAPTGTAPEDASNLLGSDATGAGVWRLGGGLALEQAYGAFLVNLTAMLSTALPRTASTTRFVYAPRWDVTLGLGYAVSHYWHLAALFNYEHEGAPSINHNPGQTRRRLDTALLVTHLLDDGLRIQGGLNLTPPISNLGRNDLARIGGTVSLVRSWL
jgi:hypothetical protein